MSTSEVDSDTQSTSAASTVLEDFEASPAICLALERHSPHVWPVHALRSLPDPYGAAIWDECDILRGLRLCSIRRACAIVATGQCCDGTPLLGEQPPLRHSHWRKQCEAGQRLLGSDDHDAASKLRRLHFACPVDVGACGFELSMVGELGAVSLARQTDTSDGLHNPSSSRRYTATSLLALVSPATFADVFLHDNQAEAKEVPSTRCSSIPSASSNAATGAMSLARGS